MYLPLRYNYETFPPHDFKKCLEEKVYSPEEYKEADINPALIHYTAGKPWEKEVHVNFSEIWWRYAKMTPFYETFFLKILRPVPPKRIIKAGLLFGILRLLTIKEDENNIKYYLFGFIPIFRLKVTRVEYNKS
jgi:lipopolysaccharide biosynthesis glycosyltransferase